MRQDDVVQQEVGTLDGFIMHLGTAPMDDLDGCKITLRPGDLLVLSTDEHLSEAACNYMRKAVAETFGKEQKVLILEGGIKLGVIER